MLRFFLALLLALTAAPMPAAACDGTMAMSGHAMAGTNHPAPMPAGHDCIGCIAVVDWDGGRIAPPTPVAAPPLTKRVAAMPLLSGQAPTPPPPRDA